MTNYWCSPGMCSRIINCVVLKTGLQISSDGTVPIFFSCQNGFLNLAWYYLGSNRIIILASGPVSWFLKRADELSRWATYSTTSYKRFNDINWEGYAARTAWSREGPRTVGWMAASSAVLGQQPFSLSGAWNARNPSHLHHPSGSGLRINVDAFLYPSKTARFR